MPFGFGQKSYVRRGGFAAPAHFAESLRQRVLDERQIGAWPQQQTPSRRRSERDRNLELRIVASTGALVGICPAVVEDIFTLRVGFHIGGHCADELSVGCLSQKMHRLP